MVRTAESRKGEEGLLTAVEIGQMARNLAQATDRLLFSILVFRNCQFGQHDLR